MQKKNDSLSYLREVPTKVGTFRVLFPCAVFNPQDNFNRIPKALAEFAFREYPPNADKKEIRLIADWNARHLQECLNQAACYGTATPQASIDILYATRTVVIN